MCHLSFRLAFKGGKDQEENLFLTVHGGNLDRIPSTVIDIFRQLSGYNGDSIITANSFRRTGATFGQRSSDPEVQRNLPSRMTHSVATAQKFYKELTAQEKRGIAAHSAQLRDLQSKMPTYFLSLSLTPRLSTVRFEGEQRVQEAARLARQQGAEAKAKRKTTSRQKISHDERKTVMRSFANWGRGRFVQLGESFEILEEDEQMQEIVRRLLKDFGEFEGDQKKTWGTIYNSYRAKMRKESNLKSVKDGQRSS